MRKSRPPVPAAAGSSLDTVSTSARKPTLKLPRGDTAYQLDLPGLEDTQDFTDLWPLGRAERRRILRGHSPCCTGPIALAAHNSQAHVFACEKCLSLYMLTQEGEGYAVIDSRTNSPIRLPPKATP